MEFAEPLSVYLFAMVIALGYARSALAPSGRFVELCLSFTQGAASLTLGYIRFALAPSGRFVCVDVVYDCGGLKAQWMSIAQGKRSVTLGN